MGLEHPGNLIPAGEGGGALEPIPREYRGTAVGLGPGSGFSLCRCL